MRRKNSLHHNYSTSTTVIDEKCVEIFLVQNNLMNLPTLSPTHKLILNSALSITVLKTGRRCLPKILFYQTWFVDKLKNSLTLYQRRELPSDLHQPYNIYKLYKRMI